VAALPALSYSSFRTYEECPLRWRFLYIDKLPEAPRGYFTFGRVIHSVLEQLVAPLVVPTARRAGESDRQRTLDEFHARGRDATPPRWFSPDELLEAYAREWSAEGYSSPEEESRYKALGRELLLRYYDFLLRERPVPVAVEEHLETRWDGIPVHGYVDRIDRTASGGLEIVDYKTSRELSNDDARESDQLSLYQVLVEKNYAEPVHGLTLYHLRSLTPLRTEPRDRASLVGLHDRFGTVLDGIRAEAFEPAPGRHCMRCDFRDRCPEFRTVPPVEGARLRSLVDRFESLRAEEGRLEVELRRTADELHRAAEELGVHRVPGTRSTLVRRREEAWQYSLDPVRPLLDRSGLSTRVGTGSTEEVRRLVRDPDVDPEVRRKVAETGARRVKWYWELEEASGDRPS
jgi:RecB family exonuclease